MLRGTFSRSEKVRTVHLSDPQWEGVKVALLEGERPDEALYRLVRNWRLLYDIHPEIKSFPVGNHFDESRQRWKKNKKTQKISGRLHPTDEAELSSIIEGGRKAQDILSEWVTCAAQLPQPRTLGTKHDVFDWLRETYGDQPDGTAIEAVAFDSWGLISQQKLLESLQALEQDGKLWLYSWPRGESGKLIYLPDGTKRSWLAFAPR